MVKKRLKKPNSVRLIGFGVLGIRPKVFKIPNLMGFGDFSSELFLSVSTITHEPLDLAR